MGGFKSLSLTIFVYIYIYVPLGFFIIRMTRHYFPLLSVNLPSVKPVSHPEEIWGHQF